MNIKRLFSGRAWVPAAAALLLSFWLLSTQEKIPRGVSWLYSGSHTTSGGEGIYLFTLQPQTGELKPKGLAAGRLWKANLGAFRSSVPRLLAQFREGWPNMKAVLHGVQEPAFLTLHPNGRFLYAADSLDPAGMVTAFQIDPANGKLTFLNSERSGGALPVYATIDGTGRNLLVANYGGSIAVLGIDTTGHLSPAASPIRRASPSHPHAIVLSPDNRFAIVTDTGLDRIFVYRFDAQSGALVGNDSPSTDLPARTAPRHFVFNPGATIGYAIGESGSSIVAMRWNADRGTLTPFQNISTLPANFRGASGGAEVVIDAKGRFLYASNRAVDSPPGAYDTIAVFAADPETGSLALVEHVSSFGRRPGSLRIAPEGRFLFASNVSSGSLVQYRIDAGSGRLTVLRSFSLPSPIGLSFAEAK